MSGFSPEWLALREPVDHRSRDRALAARLAGHLAARAELRIVDLGCGTGSNLRATAVSLPAVNQRWTLVDYDPRLLAAAATALTAWADAATESGAGLALRKGQRAIVVELRQADLAHDLEGAIGPACDLVTSSAFFDLVSAPFMRRLAQAVARRSAAFYTVLTYNGRQTWTPEHASDVSMAYAFHAHQQTDKGFGRAAGPDAPEALAAAFRAMGYAVHEGDSPWVLGAADRALVRDLAAGFATAVEETGRITAEALSAWRAIERTGAVVGHTDTLAVPG